MGSTGQAGIMGSAGQTGLTVLAVDCSAEIATNGGTGWGQDC